MSSEITPENAHLYAANVASCGIVDTNTGEFKEGYTDRKGNLVYRNPLPWWKRLLGMKSKEKLWGEWEYLTTRQGQQTLLEGGMFCKTQYHEWDVSIHIYQQIHRYTGAKRYYAKTSSGMVSDIDTRAYEREGRVVTI